MVGRPIEEKAYFSSLKKYLNNELELPQIQIKSEKLKRALICHAWQNSKTVESVIDEIIGLYFKRRDKKLTTFLKQEDMDIEIKEAVHLFQKEDSQMIVGQRTNDTTKGTI